MSFEEYYKKAVESKLIARNSTVPGKLDRAIFLGVCKHCGEGKIDDEGCFWCCSICGKMNPPHYTLSTIERLKEKVELHKQSIGGNHQRKG